MFAIFSLIGVSLLMFIIVYTLPGDPATAAAGPGASPEQIEYMRQKLGLDKPLYQQYARFVWLSINTLGSFFSFETRRGN